MGLIKDALGSAFGAGQVNNGLDGFNVPFMKERSSSACPRRTNYYDDQDYQSYASGHRDIYHPDTFSRNDFYDDQNYHSSTVDSYNAYASDSYSRNAYRSDRSYPIGSRDAYQSETYPSHPPTYQDAVSNLRLGGSSFRPIILPQMTYGDGLPFLRAYSNELSHYGIDERQFIEIVDIINVAIIPNPKNQIFQFGANIAGWFVPGAASLGLMGGQIAAGLGTYLGHASMVNRALSKANLEKFLPCGLEVCIGKTLNVDQEAGINNSSYDDRFVQASPEQRVSLYGNRVARLSSIYPPLQNAGRRDPIAMVGRALAGRKNQKNVQKAMEDYRKDGKMEKQNDLDKSLKWLIIRQASPEALSYWKQKLAESTAEIQDAANQARRDQQRRSKA